MAIHLDAFLDSTIELFRGRPSTEPPDAPVAEDNQGFWRFRVLTLGSGQAPGLYESPVYYSSDRQALIAAKQHALRAKVENTEKFPALAIAWGDDEDIVIAQNDSAIALLGNVNRASTWHLYGNEARALIKKLCNPSATVTLTLTNSRRELLKARCTVQRLEIDQTLYSYELITSCQRLGAVDVFDIASQRFP